MVPSETKPEVRLGEWTVGWSSRTVAGRRFRFERAEVEGAVREVLPEPLRDHYVIVNGRRYPPKQVLSAVTGLDRADFTTHQARRILQRAGFGVGRTGATDWVPPARYRDWPHQGREAEALRPYQGLWVAQRGWTSSWPRTLPRRSWVGSARTAPRARRSSVFPSISRTLMPCACDEVCVQRASRLARRLRATRPGRSRSRTGRRIRLPGRHRIDRQPLRVVGSRRSRHRPYRRSA